MGVYGCLIIRTVVVISSQKVKAFSFSLLQLIDPSNSHIHLWNDVNSMLQNFTGIHP